MPVSLAKFRIISFLTAVIFLISNTAYGYIPSETKPAPFHLSIPDEFGKIDTQSIQENAPLILHIQSAHGNYEAQKNIQALLNYLTQNCGFDLLLLEGGIGKIDPRFHPEITPEIADILMKKAELTGSEMFLVEKMSRGEDKKITAFGVENADLYREDRSAFQEVIRHKNMSDAFLKVLGQELDELAARNLNSELKEFLKSTKAYEEKELDLISFFRLVKKEADRNLHLDLSDTNYQIKWPMLTRFAWLDNLKSKIDAEKAEREKQAFLSKLKSLGIDFSVPKTGVRPVFEKLTESLPANFSFKPYENFRLSIQTQILQEEINSIQLFQESEQLRRQIIDSLARTKSEKETVSQFENFKLLQKLFSLTLTRDEFRILMQKQNEIEPLVQKIQFLFDTAVKFYADAKQRENAIFQNAFSRIKQSGKKRAILITGGFHSDGLAKLARQQHLSYLRVTPQINSLTDDTDYLLAMLEAHSELIQKSQIEEILKLQTMNEIRKEGGSSSYFDFQIKQAIAKSLGENPSSHSPHPLSSDKTAIEALQSFKLINKFRYIKNIYFTKNSSRYIYIVSPDSTVMKLFDLSSGIEIPIPALTKDEKFISMEASPLDSNIVFLFYYTSANSEDLDGFKSANHTYFVKILNRITGTETIHRLGDSHNQSFTLPDSGYTFTKNSPNTASAFSVTCKTALNHGISNIEQNRQKDRFKFIPLIGSTPAHFIDQTGNKIMLTPGIVFLNGTTSSNAKFGIAFIGKSNAIALNYVEKGLNKKRFINDNKLRTVKAFDMSSGKELGIDFGFNITNAEFSPSGNMLLVSYSTEDENNKVNWVKLFDLRTKQNLEFIIGPNTERIIFSSDGTIIIVHYKNKTIKIFDFKSIISNPVIRNAIQAWKMNTYAGLDLLSRLIIDDMIGNPDDLTVFNMVFQAYVDARTQSDGKIVLNPDFDYTPWKNIFSDMRTGKIKLPITVDQIQAFIRIFQIYKIQNDSKKSLKIEKKENPTQNQTIPKKSLALERLRYRYHKKPNQDESSNGSSLGNPTLANLDLLLKSIASVTLISGMAALIYGTSLKGTVAAQIGVNITNILLFSYFTIMNDLLGQWISGRGIVKKQVVSALPLGLVLGVVTWGGFKATNWALPKDVHLPVIVADIFRVIAIWFMIRVRTMLYAKMVNIVRKNGKSKEEQDKQFESFWMTRSLSFIKNYSVLKFIPAEFQTVAEGILNQYFQLFYSWSVNKEGFIFKSPKHHKSRLFLAFFPITAPVSWLTTPVTVPVNAKSLGDQIIHNDHNSWLTTPDFDFSKAEDQELINDTFEQSEKLLADYNGEKASKILARINEIAEVRNNELVLQYLNRKTPLTFKLIPIPNKTRATVDDFALALKPGKGFDVAFGDDNKFKIEQRRVWTGIQDSEIFINKFVFENLPINTLAQVFYRLLEKETGSVEKKLALQDYQLLFLLEEELEYELEGRSSLLTTVDELKTAQKKILARSVRNLDPNHPIFAIIGGGIAGATAVDAIRKKNPNAQFVVFDTNPLIGGKILYAIPYYRPYIKIPYKTGKVGIGSILSHEGIYLFPSFTIGKNISFSDFSKLPFDGIIFAAGQPNAKIDTKVEGVQGADVYGSTHFYQPFNTVELDLPGNPKQVLTGKTVFLIGGGNVSLDIARIALQEGAKKVILLYRRGYEVFSSSQNTDFAERVGTEAAGLQYEMMASIKKILRNPDGHVSGIEIEHLAYDVPELHGIDNVASFLADKPKQERIEWIKKLKDAKLISTKQTKTISGDLVVFSISDELTSPLSREIAAKGKSRELDTVYVQFDAHDGKVKWIAAGDAATGGSKAGKARTSANIAAGHINAQGSKTPEDRQGLIDKLIGIRGFSLGNSLQQDPDYQKLQRYSELHGLVSPEFVIATAHMWAGDFIFIPDSVDVLTSYVRLLKRIDRPIHTKPAIQNFNSDANLTTFLNYLKKSAGENAMPLLVEEQIIGTNGESFQQKSRLIANSLNDNDLMIVTLKDRTIPRIITELHKLAQRKFKVRTLHEKLISPEIITSMTRDYAIPPVAVTAFDNGLEVTLTHGDKIKLNLHKLIANGVDPAQVVALIRKISDEPALRNSLYFQSGFRLDQGHKFWEVGSDFIALITRIYSSYVATQQSARAA